MKIYQVCREYYDMPDCTIIKSFSSRKKAKAFKDEYVKSKKWTENHNDTECVVINEHKVE